MTNNNKVKTSLRDITESDRVTLAFERIMKASLRQTRAVKQMLQSPCQYRPGSTDKVAVLMARHELGVPMHVEGDMNLLSLPTLVQRVRETTRIACDISVPYFD